MSSDTPRWTYSNSGPEPVTIWLEPWAEEFLVPPGASAELVAGDGDEFGEVEHGPDQITVWANASTLNVYIDGKLQDSASASVPVPAGLTKAMLGILFADHPDARLGGIPRPKKTPSSRWSKIKRLFGL